MFFGRQKLLARLLNVLHHNSLMITGERRIGKTTFLYHLKKVLEADEGTEYRFFPVLTDLQGVPETQLLPRRHVATWWRSLRPVPRRAARRAALPARSAAPTTAATSATTSSASSRSSRPAPRSKVKLALLIDEVDVLNEYSERINQRLRSIFMKTFSESLVAIMSGVGIKRTWKSEVSPWYNFFDEIELSRLHPRGGGGPHQTPVEGVFRYEPAAVERILELRASSSPT